jgi:tetratricopeptide (TPR) repeat protein
MLSLLLTATFPAAPTSSGSANLVAAAAASGRPRECMSSARRALAAGPTIWEKARIPTLQRYCDLVARAHAELATNPEAARQDAALADKALSGRAAPAVILARAALALGAIDDAAREFTRARSIDARSVEDPATMHDLARVLQRTGKRSDALAVYRALVPRIDLLGSTDRRVSVLLEAAHASMAAESAAPASPAAAGQDASESSRSKLDEAIAYLREARQRPPTQLAGDVLLSLVLVLDRSGDRAQADAALGDAHRTGARIRSSALDYLAVPEDRHALEALALEGSDRAQAIKGWEAYLASAAGKGPWAGEAKARLEALRRGAKSPPAGAEPAPAKRGSKRKGAP